MVVPAILLLGGLGATFGVALSIAYRKLSVPVDPREEKIVEILPGANCGACGHAGCFDFAHSLVEGKGEVTDCTVGGNTVTKRLAEILGVNAELKEPMVALVHCQGGEDKAKKKFDYYGVQDCAAAHLLHGGNKVCSYGCLGLGSCVRACPFDAITITENNIAVIDPDKCTACGKCVPACPIKIIDMVPRSRKVKVLCRSLDRGKYAKDACSVACFACNVCVRVCPEKAITINNNLAVINYDLCNSCNKCVEKCPAKTIINEQI